MATTSEKAAERKVLQEKFIAAMVIAGYSPSSALQLWYEQNPWGSYGLFMKGEPIPVLTNKPLISDNPEEASRLLSNLLPGFPIFHTLTKPGGLTFYVTDENGPSDEQVHNLHSVFAQLGLTLQTGYSVDGLCIIITEEGVKLYDDWEHAKDFDTVHGKTLAGGNK